MSTFDPVTRLFNCDLSGGNLTAATHASSQSGARSTTSKTSGKVYWTYQYLATVVAFSGMGLQDTTFDPSTASNFIGFASGGNSFIVAGDGSIRIGGSSLGFLDAAPVQNDQVGVAYDFGANTVRAARYHAGAWQTDSGLLTVTGFTVTTGYAGFGGNNASDDTITWDPTAALGQFPALAGGGYVAWDTAAPPLATVILMGAMSL